jgi:hypothetical protein
VAFRDPNSVLREQLEAAEKEIARLRARNAELSAGHAPRVRALAFTLGVTTVLGGAMVVHLAAQNRGLETTRRAQEDLVGALRQDLETHRHGRELAESALLAEQAEARDRAALALDRAASLQDQAWRAGPSRPPTPAEPTRLFWVVQASGREDLSEGSPCEVTIHQEPGPGGANTCGVSVSCRDQGTVPVFPGARIACTARPDGWIDATTTVEGRRVSFGGPRVSVGDLAEGWTVSMTNRRPCER